MALGSLFLLFVGMSLLAIIGSILLFKLKDKKNLDILLVVMAAYSLVIAYLGANAEPVNFVAQQISHWVVGFLGVIGLGLRFGTKRQSTVSKALVAVSVIAGIYTLFLM